MPSAQSSPQSENFANTIKELLRKMETEISP